MPRAKLMHSGNLLPKVELFSFLMSGEIDKGKEFWESNYFNAWTVNNKAFNKFIFIYMMPSIISGTWWLISVLTMNNNEKYWKLYECTYTQKYAHIYTHDIKQSPKLINSM